MEKFFISHNLDGFIYFGGGDMDEETAGVMLGALVFVIIVVVVSAIIASLSNASKKSEILGESDRERCPRLREQAVVVNKTEPGKPGTPDYNFYPHIVFDLSGGRRIKLAIQDRNVFDSIVVGDRGMLEYAGRAFISFSRY